MFLQVFADDNDVEGVVWEGNQGTEWISRANGNIALPKEQMQGRPIGFRVWMGKGGKDNQPLLMAVVYNACNCPASTYLGNDPFPDLEIEAVFGATQTETLIYRQNYIESVYNQDCGAYSIDYDPKLPFFEFSESGATDIRGKMYTDLGMLTAGTI